MGHSIAKTLLVLMVISCLLVESTGWRRRRRRRACSASNCQVSGWTYWSGCSDDCGTEGLKHRTRSITVPASCGGSCYGLVESESCNNPGCNGHGIPQSGYCICYTGWHGTCCDHEVEEDEEDDHHHHYDYDDDDANDDDNDSDEGDNDNNVENSNLNVNTINNGNDWIIYAIIGLAAVGCIAVCAVIFGCILIAKN